MMKASEAHIYAENCLNIPKFSANISAWEFHESLPE